MECALTNFFNEHFLYGQYYFSMYKHSYEEVKPDCVHKYVPGGLSYNKFSPKLDKVTQLCVSLWEFLLKYLYFYDFC